jgi:hypothetical protein
MKCPKQEALFEFISIPDELSRWERFRTQWHTRSCASCQEQMQAIRSTWESYFTPEPDVTSSMMRVYSRLQSDETLILKGWKLSEFRPARAPLRARANWAFRIGASFAAALLLVVFAAPQWRALHPVADAAAPVPVAANEHLPFAQIRVEDKDNNRVQVHYVQPELLQSVEFETTSAR